MLINDQKERDEECYEIVYKFKDHNERDEFCLAMQWTEDRDSYARSMRPTNISELGLFFGDNDD